VHTKLLSQNLKGKRPLGRPRRRWEDNIRMDLGEIRWKSSEEGLVVGPCEYINKPSGSIKGEEFLD